MNLFLRKIYNGILKRSQLANNKKSRESWLAKGYIKDPVVSFIIQSHNKGAEVIHIVKKLRTYPNAEIIVIDDGSGSSHTHKLSGFLNRANEFLIRSNDLYENIMYDKAIRFANGDYLVLMQDDDDFAGLEWVDKALDLFTRHPDMVILGGCGGFDFDKNETAQKIVSQEQTLPAGGFRFVQYINRAPMIVRKDLYRSHLKNIDYSFAPFQYDDVEICLRAWLRGLSVGWYDAAFTSLSAGGMRIWNNRITQTQVQLNSARIYDMYRDQKDEIDRLVEKKNCILSE